MTIRTRNRLNIGLFVISNIFLLLYIVMLIFSIFTGRFQLPYELEPGFFLTTYNPYVVILSLFFQIIYVSVTSMVLFRSFEKTQASDIIYFYLFLVACLIDSFRLLVPLFGISNTYSNLLIFCGNATVFARILIPISLLFSVIFNTVEKRQDIEKNIFILILISIFFAGFIPLNTAITTPNFSVSYSYKFTLKVTTLILILSSIITMFVDNKKHTRKQITTVGFALISIGIYCLFQSTDIIKFVISIT